MLKILEVKNWKVNTRYFWILLFIPPALFSVVVSCFLQRTYILYTKKKCSFWKETYSVNRQKKKKITQRFHHHGNEQFLGTEDPWQGTSTGPGTGWGELSPVGSSFSTPLLRGDKGQVCTRGSHLSTSSNHVTVKSHYFRRLANHAVLGSNCLNAL